MQISHEVSSSHRSMSAERDKLGTISLYGGPRDGMEAPHGDGLWPVRLENLLVLPERPRIRRRGSKAYAHIQLCRYVHRDQGVYDFDFAKDGLMVMRDYLALKAAQEIFERLRSLASDPRLVGEPAQNENGLPLAEAMQMKEAALPRYRAWLRSQGEPADRLSDEQVWAILAERTLGTLVWADIGALAHFDSLRELAFDIFDIEIVVPPQTAQGHFRGRHRQRD